MNIKQDHRFIFIPGTWIGEGTISFSSSPERIHFYTKWLTNSWDPILGFICTQQVEMQGVEENVFNKLAITEILDSKFVITLENNLIGSVVGKGIINEETIAWEYRKGSDFEGFEVYELQKNGDYLLHAEYASSDEYRTVIDGRIWLKSS